jgi:hypothetical protein
MADRPGGLFEEQEFGSRSEPRVEVGDWVKVGLKAQKERFWCRVVGRRVDGAIVAQVDNDLVRSSHGCGDELVLMPRHVLDVTDMEGCVAFSHLASVLGPVEAARAWHALRAL